MVPFTEIGMVLIRVSGVAYERAVFERGGEIYAAHRNGYARLLGLGRTSCDGTTWYDLELDPAYTIENDRLGRPVVRREDTALPFVRRRPAF